MDTPGGDTAILVRDMDRLGRKAATRGAAWPVPAVKTAAPDLDAATFVRDAVNPGGSDGSGISLEPLRRAADP